MGPAAPETSSTSSKPEPLPPVASASQVRTWRSWEAGASVPGSQHGLCSGRSVSDAERGSEPGWEGLR